MGYCRHQLTVFAGVDYSTLRLTVFFLFTEINSTVIAVTMNAAKVFLFIIISFTSVICFPPILNYEPDHALKLSSKSKTDCHFGKYQLGDLKNESLFL